MPLGAAAAGHDTGHLVLTGRADAQTLPVVRADQPISSPSSSRPRTSRTSASACSRSSDKLFPVDDGRELAAVLPQGRFELVEGARTFSMLDRTEALAALVLDVAEARTPAPD